jgi:Putative zinc-finger
MRDASEVGTMNCENYQDLLSEFIDGSLVPEDHNQVEIHLSECVACAEVRGDLDAIAVFCREHREEYDAVPNERALWLRISNTIASESSTPVRKGQPGKSSWWASTMRRRWQVSLPQLAGSALVMMIVVALGTVIGVRRFQTTVPPPVAQSAPLEDRYQQQQQLIAYWNQRVEENKARWSQQMRDAFDKNMSVIDAAVNDSMLELKKNPHDGVSEDVLNSALNDKVELLREFAEL